MTAVGTSRDRAERLLALADGLEDAGFVRFARLGRDVARELLRALDDLDAERSARVSIQEARDRAVDLLAAHAGAALIDDQEGGRR